MELLESDSARPRQARCRPRTLGGFLTVDVRKQKADLIRGSRTFFKVPSDIMNHFGRDGSPQVVIGSLDHRR